MHPAEIMELLLGWRGGDKGRFRGWWHWSRPSCEAERMLCAPRGRRQYPANYRSGTART
jgi:hypothetical protein